MRVFVTGASGHIGSAVVPELLSAGHQVVGLARSDSSAAALDAAGAAIHRGDLGDLDGLQAAAAAADAVIHLAFDHDAMQAGDYAGSVGTDLRAVEAIGDALAGTGKAFVGTSGTLLLAFGGVQGLGTEDAALAAGPRVEAENLVVALAERDVRSSVVRLPPTVHSTLDHHGFIPALIGFARGKGAAGYLADGSNRWPAGHTLDAARLYRLAVEKAPPGSRLHAVGDEGVAFRDIADSFGRHLGLPVVAVEPAEAADYFGFLAGFVGLDNPTSSTRTQELLGWTPTGPGLLDDLEQGHYFA